MNLSCKVLFLFLFSLSTLAANTEKKEPHEITIEIKIKCPMSEELKEFVKSIPEPEKDTVSLDEWKESFTNSMTHLIYLIESKKIYNSHWSVKTDDQLPELVKEGS